MRDYQLFSSIGLRTVDRLISDLDDGKILDAQRVLTEHVASQQMAARMVAPVSHSVPVKPFGHGETPGGHGEGYAGRGTQEQYAETGNQTDAFTTSYTRVEVLEPGGVGAARIEQLSSRPHVEFLMQHVKGKLTVPGDRGSKPAAVNVLLDTGSGVTSISEELVPRMHQENPGKLLVQTFQGSARVWTSSGGENTVTKQTKPLLLITLLTPWGRARFRLPFIILPGPGELLILGQVTLREVLQVDVMADLKRCVLGLRDKHEGGLGETPRAGPEDTEKNRKEADQQRIFELQAEFVMQVSRTSFS